MILTSEANTEFVSNRLNSKIKFLQEENNQLREYVKDLESQAKLNKEALKISLKPASKSIKQNQNSATIEEQQVF